MMKLNRSVFVRVSLYLYRLSLSSADMQAAPLWDSQQCKFVGLLTVTDFIDILRQYRPTEEGAQPRDVAELAVHSISEVLLESGGTAPRPFHGAAASCTLYAAARQLLTTNQDFLPVVYAEDMRVLACLTYTNFLEHLVTHFREQRRLFDDSITDLGIGTYGEQNVATIRPTQTLAEALDLMVARNLSALPVVDDQHKVIGVYSRSDITFLTQATDANDAVRHLDTPVQEILRRTRQDVTTPDALRTCSPTHTLQAIFESFAQVRFHRLYVVDQEQRLLGVVSAKDLVAYFLGDEEQ
jgi:5'-AMP-activated protein kinase regulatory gamma subunit